ncbi:LamG-like jellyroll fold domain-containing protein [Nocardiopsis alba]|uniref:Concanavalin A-like lectin/glucanases superfamily protein n=1 Tax=Nocardiopsis alba (strain ATCC BAA-2165 / BE74) TaxID=1205910 RepID=J7LC98_NOCAA|nr:LamG-like jellyroll fold domain-containing protein [Nocardiopsis alba]AFR08444.1 concanavalin A-like lectin/glucanases superfamily protein [Nocardiopsis alba ATCC BAA-2165]
MCRSLTRATAVSTAGALVLSLMFAPPVAAEPDPPDPSDSEQQQEFDALALAEQSGEPVEIPGLTDEKTRHLANPDGSLTAEISALPVRTRSADGWVDIDTTLVKAEDGIVRPRAAGMDIAFSGGGDADMARIGIGSNSVSLGWVEELPEPTLEGDRATYADVLPDVDLVLTAGAEGFNQVLVVHTPEAARLPELAELELPLSTTGVTMTVDEHGNLDAVGDNGGQSVFSAEAPAMWDSTADPEAVEIEDPVAGPFTTSKVELVETSVNVDRIRLIPDQGMLLDEATEFPIYIDPSVNASRPNWAYVDRAFPNQSYFNPSVASVGVGRVVEGGTYTRRAFFQFTVMARTNQANTVINSATLRTEVEWAYSCTSNSYIQLQRVGAFNRNTTWNNQPSTQGGVLDTQNVRGGWATCPASSGVEFDATAAYRWGANNNASHIYLRLKERDESGSSAWRRFNTRSKPPVLVVNYNNPPAQVSTAGMSDSLGGACSTDKDNPRLINNTTTTFRATIRDYDARAAWGGQKLKVRFAWWADGEGDRLGEADSTYADVGYWPNGSERAVTVSGLPENRLLGYRARAHDQIAWGDAWSGWCWIKIDTTKPDTGPRVSSNDYPNDETPHGSVGRSGDFTFDNNGVEEATAYHYSLNDTSCNTEVRLDSPGASVTVPITPRHNGANMIYARTVDAYGNSSECELAYYFLAAPPSGPVAHFRLGEGEGDTAVDSVDTGRTATASGDIDWTRGRVGEPTGRGYRLEGAALDTNSGQRLRTENPIIDTDSAFSVSAWVRLDETDPSRAYTAVAQDGERHSGFYLGYQHTQGGRWIFKQAPYDGDATAISERVLSTERAQRGVWTHLLGTYDPEDGALTLYVDGVAQGTHIQETAWNAEGPFVIGGAKYRGTYYDFWPGAIDDVRVWDRVLTDDAAYATDGENSEVWNLANRPIALEGRWRLDETEGTIASDSSDHGLDATLHADPLTAWNDALNEVTFAPGVSLNVAEREHLTTEGPAIRADRSYSVATWARLDEVGNNATAVAQNGTDHSAFYLGYQHTLDYDNWVMKLPPEDRTGARGWHRSLSNQTAEFGRWTHLAATYDHTRGEVELFVDGVGQGAIEVSDAWHASGETVIGGARFEKSFFDPWSGDLSDVHTYQGVLDEDEIRAVMEGISPAPSL